MFLTSVAKLTCHEGVERVRNFIATLESGDVILTSQAGQLQRRLCISQERLRLYRAALAAAPSVEELVLALSASVEMALAMQGNQSVVETVWTFPGKTRPGLRTTGRVAREIIDNSRQSLLLVGYAITVDSALAGLASQTIEAIARAAERGVVVTAVLNRSANRNSLLQVWRAGVKPPSIFTWPVSQDYKATIHAKLLVSDRLDVLVTSANLTYHGFEANLEMGLRVKGKTAAEIHDQIYELIAVGQLVRWAP